MLYCPLHTDPKIFKSTVGFLNCFSEKNNIKALKTEKYKPKEGDKQQTIFNFF